jgi:C4-dicarboxylate-specific signal transduction histidine kinase
LYFFALPDLIIIFTISYLLYYFIIIWSYTKKITSFSSRFSSLNILNKHLNQKINRLRQSSDQLKKIIARKDIELLQVARHASLAEVTTGIAHELSQPLTGIKCIAQNLIDDIICKELDNEQASSDLEKINSLVDRSSSIIDHIRTFSRKRGFSLHPVNINTCILNAIDLINNQMKKNSIDVIFVLDDTIPEIWGDNLSLEQLFINLILNSKDAILSRQDDEPYLSGYIKITTALQENQVTLIIEDNGSGIPEDIITKIWTPFFTTKLKGKGTGIGLSLSHRIIKEHNAEVLVETFSTGTVFTIRFPLGAPDQ